jgi:dienelactone hydrolase
MSLLPVLLLALCIPLATTRAAAMHITDPWPDPAAITGIRVTHVTLRSSDPFVPRDFGHAPPRTVSAQLFLPADASPASPVPAVVLLHGSAGNADERAATYGPPLAAMGIAVMVIETYASRPDLGTGFIQRVLNITESMFVADAYAALGYLAAQPEIDAHRVVLAGFSYGGMATTYALYAQTADKLAPPGLRFAGHVAFYAPCIARFADSRTTGAPLLMLYGAEDQLMRADRCAQVADDLRHGGSRVDIIVYPDTVHQWDGHRPLGVIGRQLAACRFRVAPDGTVRDQRTLLPMNGPVLRKLILGLCTSPPPYPIGRNQQTVLTSNRDFGRFLARVFATDPAHPPAILSRAPG